MTVLRSKAYFVLMSLFIVRFTCSCANAALASQDKRATVTVSTNGGEASLLQEALALLHNGRLDDAAQRFLQILAAEAYTGLTRVYLKQKKVQQAHETIARGLVAVDSAAIHVALGEVLFREGELLEAEREWLAVVNSGHADARAHLGLSRLSAAATWYRQAKTEIEKAHTLDPDDPDIQLYWLRSLGPSEQVPYLEEYLSHESTLSPEELTHLRTYLEFLKVQANSSVPHACRLAVEPTSFETSLLLVRGDRPDQIRAMAWRWQSTGTNPGYRWTRAQMAS